MSKIVITLTLFLGATYMAIAQETYKITVEFSGMKTDKGNLYVGLYDNAASFLKNGIQNKLVSVKGKKAKVVFEGVKPGEYAISSFHDENDNKKMDTRIFGIPKEPVGLSKDAKGFMGPPKYKDAKFIVDKDITLKINMY
ncbi:Uncharacterized conserved protein, DUF2141 family [Tenacibaculum sp. MAR_2009_124]|uniref:DUF2141 domain-containing protein n=1 Tax=Tenacibaculum sp. MAR_2009_124 TaxID=1250059 RepID=UPI00089B268C|nr:DUF2141 domain-containing protein [Tenacibaculum sp. MAR_2009_124]SEB81454.1 Uncharacterized conserved protein, DUF2141 family [Tenacibaculum sp. MAR_2009_124]